MKITETTEVTLSLTPCEVVKIVEALRWTAVTVQHWTPLPAVLNGLWGVLADSCEEARRNQQVAEVVGDSPDDFVIPGSTRVLPY